MQDIAQLSRTADALGRAASFWNSAIIVFLAFTALAATGIFVAQHLAFRRADELARIQSQIANLKEAQAKQTILGLQTSAVQALNEEKRVELELSVQREKTAEAENRVLELEGRLRPRSLNTAQINIFLNTLRKGPSGSIELFGISPDEESKNFARELETLLRSAGWQVSVSDAYIMSGSPKGLEMIVPNKEHPPARAVNLLSALKRVGYEMNVLSFNGPVAEDRLRLTIGTKP